MLWPAIAAISWILLVGVYEWVRVDQSGPLCLMRRTTGIPCATCGTTRSVLAAANGNLIASMNRNIVAAKMTTDDVTKAEQMAREWLAKHGKAD